MFIIGARQLITYRRLPEGELSDISKGRTVEDDRGVSASELNTFRRKVRHLCSTRTSIAV